MKKESINTDKYFIHYIMNKRKQVAILLGIWLIAIVFFSIILFSVKYNREIVVLNIQSDTLNLTQFGFQYAPLADGFFKSAVPKGNFRLYYSIESNYLKEIVYAGAINDVGNGIFIIPDTIQFPDRNDTWTAKFELKDKNLLTISKKCIVVDFIINGQSKVISQKECPFYYG